MVRMPWSGCCGEDVVVRCCGEDAVVRCCGEDVVVRML